MASPRGDLFGVGTGGDPQSDRGVPQIVRPKGPEIGCFDCWRPESLAPRVQVYRSAFRGCADEVLRSARVRLQVLGQWLRGHARERNDSATCARLGRPDVQVASDVNHDFGDVDRASESVDAFRSQPKEFAGSETTVRREEHRRPVSVPATGFGTEIGETGASRCQR
jgi:hypothetical protein